MAIIQPSLVAIIPTVLICLHLKGVMSGKPCANPPVCSCNTNMTQVNCWFRGLTSIPELPVTAVTVELSGNNIAKIPSRAFAQLSKLQRLYLSSSNIQTLEPLAFEGLDNLTHLHLSGNNISRVPTRAFMQLTKLENLFLSNSHIHSVDSFAFDGLYNLTTLNLRGNKIQILVSKSFANIQMLNRVYLGLNKIEKVAADAFNGTERISEIYLSNNLLSEVPSIGPQHRLNTLSLSHNQIVNATFPTSYRNCDGNLSIDLSYNKIEILDEFTLSSLAGTTIVDMELNNNSIAVVGAGTFDSPASMEMLYIGKNPLGSEALKNLIVGCNTNDIMIELEFSTDEELVNDMCAVMKVGINLGLCSTFRSKHVFEEFHTLTIIKLTTKDLITFISLDFPGKKNVLAMDLSGMDISSFPKYLPTSLESLDLRRNKISYLYSNEMSYLGRLKVLLLAENGIHFISSGAFNSLGNDLAQTGFKGLSRGILNPLHNLTHLYLVGNGIRKLRKVSSPLVSLRVLDLSDNNIEYVDAPLSESFQSLHMLNLEGNNLGTTVFQSDIGGRLFRGLSDLNELSISSNNIRSLPDLIFQDQIYLKVLILSMNHISNWGPNVFQFTRNMEKIDVSVNSISLLTESNLRNLNNLKELNLRDNKFRCNCDLLWFREWIDRTAVILPDKESYMCDGPEGWKGKPLLEFTRDKIVCPSNISKYVTPGSVIGTMAVTVLFGILIYRYRWRLRLRVYLLSKRGRRFIRDRRGHVQHPNYGAINDGGRRDDYDAYISCCECDNDWVLRHLLPDIDSGDNGNDEFGGEFKLYYDPRDKDPGTMAIANIFEHMTRSRKVIVVLTENYVKAGINTFELDQAMTLYNDQDLDDVIVIKVGHVATKKVPVHLYTQMRTGKFLEWEDDQNAIEVFKGCLVERLRGERVDLC